MAGLTVDFRYAPILRRALLSEASVKIVQGPVESGKSVYSLFQLYYWACTMPRCIDGVRRSRFLVHRTTEQELKRGIMRTAANFFDEDVYGAPEGSMPAIHRMKFLDVETEFEYIAFEEASEAVLKKLRSTEYTGALINEGQFVDQTLFMEIWKRMGRYPPKPDPSSRRPNPRTCPDYDKKKRVVMDMNAPRVNDHWVLRMRGDVSLPADMPFEERRKYRKPDGWEFFVQPPVVRPLYNEMGEIEDFELNPKAENLPYQDRDAILSAVSTGDLDDVKRDYMNLVIQVKRGRPRYAMFRKDFHVSAEKLKPVEGIPPIIGYDPGINGAATFWQKVNGQWRCYKEMICRDKKDLSTAEQQGQYMKDVLTKMFPWYRQTGVIAWGDPFGTRANGTESTYFDTIAKLGIQFRPPALKDNPSLRRETGSALLKRSSFGQPSLLLCPVGCPVLIEAFDGGAVMKVVRKDGEMSVREELEKNSRYADPIESAEYAFWGDGEDNSIVELPAERAAPKRVETVAGRSKVFTRRGRSSVRKALRG